MRTDNKKTLTGHQSRLFLSQDLIPSGSENKLFFSFQTKACSKNIHQTESIILTNALERNKNNHIFTNAGHP
jgi:hypothetical protein